jgi:hypothetical protein
MLLASCMTDFGEDPPYVQFGSLKVGQQSFYLRLRGYKYGDTSSNVFESLPDTLVVRVIGRDGSGFILEDYLTIYSKRGLSWFDTVRYVYHVNVAADTLRIRGTSHLFWSWYGYGASAALCLSPVTGPAYTQTGWKITGDPHGEWRSSGYILNAQILGHHYAGANLYYDHFEGDVDLQPGIPYYCGYVGVTFIYSKEFGMIRSRFVGEPELDQGLCWDLMLP